MDDKTAQNTANIIKLLLGKVVELEAANEALLTTLLGVAKKAGLDPETIHAAHEQFRQAQHERALIEIERSNPWLAGILDTRPSAEE